jgi:hypothetical protein
MDQFEKETKELSALRKVDVTNSNYQLDFALDIYLSSFSSSRYVAAHI